MVEVCGWLGLWQEVSVCDSRFSGIEVTVPGHLGMLLRITVAARARGVGFSGALHFNVRSRRQ